MLGLITKQILTRKNSSKALTNVKPHRISIALTNVKPNRISNTTRVFV